MPSADEIFDKVGLTGRFYTRLDLWCSYWQCPVDPASRPLLGFIWGTTVWYWTRMPMNARNSTAKFQRMMDREIGQSRLSHCATAYVDDILIWSATAPHHIEDVRSVLLMLRNCGLRAHPQESLVCADVIEFIEIFVSLFGVSPVEAKVQAVRALRTPSTVKELQHVLGYMNFYRNREPHYSAIAKPLTCLLWNSAGGGLCLCECFGGLSAGPEMCLAEGIPVSRYPYCDHCPAARAAIQHQVPCLVAPLLLTASSARCGSCPRT